MYHWFMSSPPQVQTNDPLGEAFSFEGCIVLKDLNEWKSVLNIDLDARRENRRYFYFSHNKSIWECHIHVNIACVTPVRYQSATLYTDFDTIVRYLGLTASQTTKNYRIVNRVGYAIYLYIPIADAKETPKGFIQKDECTTTVLDDSIVKSREYKYLITFNDRWEMNREQKNAEIKLPAFSGFAPNFQDTSGSKQPLSFKFDWNKGASKPEPSFALPPSTSPSFQFGPSTPQFQFGPSTQQQSAFQFTPSTSPGFQFPSKSTPYSGSEKGFMFNTRSSFI